MQKLRECIGCHKFLLNTYKFKSGKFICKKCLDKIETAQRRISNDIIDYLKDKGITNPNNQIIILENVINSIKFDNNMLGKGRF